VRTQPRHRRGGAASAISAKYNQARRRRSEGGAACDTKLREALLHRPQPVRRRMKAVCELRVQAAVCQSCSALPLSPIVPHRARYPVGPLHGWNRRWAMMRVVRWSKARQRAWNVPLGLGVEPRGSPPRRGSGGRILQQRRASECGGVAAGEQTRRRCPPESIEPVGWARANSSTCAASAATLGWPHPAARGRSVLFADGVTNSTTS